MRDETKSEKPEHQIRDTALHIPSAVPKAEGKGEDHKPITRGEFEALLNRMDTFEKHSKEFQHRIDSFNSKSGIKL